MDHESIIMNKRVKNVLFIFIWVASIFLVIYLYDLNNRRLAGVYNSSSKENYSRLKFFLDDYHRFHGNYPPRIYQRNPNEPYHSWRILLLAHMPGEASEIYNKYDFSQEWDSAFNLKVLGDYVPKEYYVDNLTPKTPYLFHDIDNEWPFNGWMSSCIYKSGDDIFIIIVNPGSDVHWAEPRF